MAPMLLRRKKPSSSKNVDKGSADSLAILNNSEESGQDTSANLPKVDETSNRESGFNSDTDAWSIQDTPASINSDVQVPRPQSPNTSKVKGASKTRRPHFGRQSSSHRIFSSSSSKSTGSNSSAITAFGESIANTFSFSLQSSRKNAEPAAQSNSDPTPTSNPISSAPIPSVSTPTLAPRISAMFSRSKRSHPNSRSSTPQLLGGLHESTTATESDTKKSSVWKFRRRGGSISSLTRATDNNSSSVSLFAFGTRSERSSVDDLHRISSSHSAISNTNGYLSASNSTSLRPIPKSSSIRSLIDFRRHKDVKSDSDTDFSKSHTTKESTESGTKSVLPGGGSSVSSGPKISDLLASPHSATPSSSPNKIAFEIPGFMVTHADESQFETVSNKERSLSNGAEKKPHSLLGSFVNLLDTSNHDTSIPRSASALSLHHVSASQKSEKNGLRSSNSTSAFKLPLLKLKEKLLGIDASEPRVVESPQLIEIEPPVYQESSRSLAPSIVSPPLSPRSLAPVPSNEELPFPEVDLSHNASEPMIDFPEEERPPNPFRPRSHTLSSLEKSTHSSFSRPSIGGLFTSKRSDSEPMMMSIATPLPIGRQTPSPRLSDSLQRSSLSLPIRVEGEPPEEYLDRVRQLGFGSYTASALSKHGDDFHMNVLKLYLQLFSFVDDPLDMALRKFLIHARLPQETQHIDRLLDAFALRYHECNPDIYMSAAQAYFVAFSLMLLHSDFFNKNNKHKMQKVEYLKNTDSSKDDKADWPPVSPDILGVSFFFS